MLKGAQYPCLRTGVLGTPDCGVSLSEPPHPSPGLNVPLCGMGRGVAPPQSVSDSRGAELGALSVGPHASSGLELFSWPFSSPHDSAGVLASHLIRPHGSE